MNWSKTEPVRLWLYGIAGPILALLAFKGVIAGDEIGYWVALGASVFGIGIGGEAARSKAYAPATVKDLTEQPEE